jgi:hypothetical protein
VLPRGVVVGAWILILLGVSLACSVVFFTDDRPATRLEPLEPNSYLAGREERAALNNAVNAIE